MFQGFAPWFPTKPTEGHTVPSRPPVAFYFPSHAKRRIFSFLVNTLNTTLWIIGVALMFQGSQLSVKSVKSGNYQGI